MSAVHPPQLRSNPTKGHILLRFLPLLVFLAVPITEIALFITIGERIGVWATLAIVIITAIIGTSLLRTQGLSALRQVSDDLNANRLPVAGMIDGAFLLVAALLLLTPGFLTDSFGFLLFVPQVRRSIGRRIVSIVKARGVVQTHDGASQRPPPRGGPSGWQDGPVIDADAVEIDPKDR